MSTFTRMAAWFAGHTDTPEDDPAFGPESLSVNILVLVQAGTVVRLMHRHGEGEWVLQDQTIAEDEHLAGLLFFNNFASLNDDPSLCAAGHWGEGPTADMFGPSEEDPREQILAMLRALTEQAGHEHEPEPVKPVSVKRDEYVGMYL